MASIILSSIGSSIGNSIVPGLGGRLLGSLARKVGRGIDNEIGWSNAPEVKDGPRLENFKVQDSRYGIAIPCVFGKMRVAGNVIWASDIIETPHKENVNGGKGGVIDNAFSATRTTYTYSINCAIAIAAGEIGSIQTIWADSKVIYQGGVWNSGVVGSSNFHEGRADQAVDPLLEGWIGSGLTPAYRGVAYIVLQGLQLKGFGNRLPNLTFEVLPKDAQEVPRLLGEVDPVTMHGITVNKQGGMMPIVIDGGAVSARRMLIGGFACDGAQAYAEVTDYDVTGDAPVEVTRTVSDIFNCEEVAAHTWAIAPDNRMIAIGMQDSAGGYPFRVRLYDSATRSFGAILMINMLAVEGRQMIWLDAHHLAVMDQRDGKRGVRVLLRSGSSLVDCGFYDVWGAGSAVTRKPVYYTQFKALGSGAMMMVGDRAPNFTAFYGRHLSWVNNALVVGDELTIVSGIDVGSGSGMQVRVESSGEDEWTLFYLTAIDRQMMSFVPSLTSVTITRPWQVITSAVMGAVSCNAPMIAGGKIVMLHRPSLENAYRLSEIALDDGVFTLTRDAALVEDCSVPSSSFGVVVIDASRFLVSGNVGTDGTLGSLAIIKRRNTGDTLDSIVAQILNRAGYVSGDYDVTALADTVIDGYALTDQASAASALAPLQLVAPFDLVERGSQLVAVRHGGGQMIAIDEGDVAAADEKAPEITTSRAQELDLPVEVTCDYHDASRDYEVGSQRARRSVTRGTRGMAKVEVPVVCTASTAKQMAERLLYSMWVERDSFRFFLSRQWLAVEPSDIVVIGGKRVRVTRVENQKDGLLQIDGVAAVPENFGSTAQAEGGEGSNNGAASFVPSVLHLMDLPLLRNADDQAGVYVTMSGLDGWQGATLWRSEDQVNFSRVMTVTDAATSGVAVSAMAARSVHVMDRVSTVRVQLLRGSLSSCTEEQLLNGANAALIGGEIVQFQTASLIETGLYELSGFLRGRRGTASAAHQLGEAFVLLDETCVQFLPAVLTDRNKVVHFRAVSDGGSLDFAQDIPFAFGFRTLAPLAPVHLRGVREDGGDVAISWVRRARKNAAWADYIDVPLDESEERYVVEVMNGATVMRAFDVVGAAAVTYTAAMQTADWGASVPAMFAVRVCQVSATYGRGDGVEVTV
ncbi:MAG TPA: hypothetical protein DCY07_01700 [Rhodospirillaceae bacterium]|nr:hypothetical protein [Rhodospirillaceae bacterium]